jgi:hypothetical protein
LIEKLAAKRATHPDGSASSSAKSLELCTSLHRAAMAQPLQLEK